MMNPSKFAIALLCVYATTLSHSSFASSRKAKQVELEPWQITQDLVDMHALDGEDMGDTSRINDIPANDVGKIIIKVTTSTARGGEHLEVFRQKSANADDLEPINLFKEGTSNFALVSTATPSFKCRGGRPCSTPRGTFNLDGMELMHHSSRFHNAPMPHSMFFMGEVGIAIHGIVPSEYKDLGSKASHGCVRIHPANAALLYEYISKEANGRRNVVVKIN